MRPCVIAARGLGALFSAPSSHPDDGCGCAARRAGLLPQARASIDRTGTTRTAPHAFVLASASGAWGCAGGHRLNIRPQKDGFFREILTGCAGRRSGAAHQTPRAVSAIVALHVIDLALSVVHHVRVAIRRRACCVCRVSAPWHRFEARIMSMSCGRALVAR